MSIVIALAGNPNSGKTTLFNDLTGSSQYVGNWPGVTVEKKEGRLKGNKEVVVQDLPGIYSLSPYTLEEVVSRNYLINERPDAIINIVDASNLERNLYLTTQLMELGLPVVVALNMMDVVEKSGDTINAAKLSALLGCPVIEVSAVKGRGVKELVQAAIEAAQSKTACEPRHLFEGKVEESIDQIEAILRDNTPLSNLRWHAVKFFERDQSVAENVPLPDEAAARIESLITACEDALDDDSESIVTNERYTYITKHIKGILNKKSSSNITTSDKIDSIVTNRVLALPIFAAVMFIVYYLSISSFGGMMTDWVNDALFGEFVPGYAEAALESLGTAEWLNALILDGIIGGVGAVLGFLPQMLVLFLCLAILEDSGYMARIAFIMDRIFRKFGLSGKSFIPILIGTGCGVPGIMASRTIESENDRRMTVITTTFIPCGAKLPIIALIAGAIFDEAVWVGPVSYFIGVAAIILSGVMLKKTRFFAGDPAPFVMELPAYHMPRLKGVLLSTYERGSAFVKKAGTIILLACALIWFLSSFNGSFEMVDAEESLLASIGNLVAPLFAPLGWGNWKAAVATFTGLVAKENVVGTFGILYGMEEVAEDGVEIWSTLRADYTPLAAFSFLVFNLLCAPCFAAIGAIRREMVTAKWTFIAIAYQTGLAYVAALIIYQLGLAFTGGGFTPWAVIAAILLAFIIYMLLKAPYDPSNLKGRQAKELCQH